MKGTWTGHRERIAQTEGYRNGTATLVVTEEQGLTFKGTMHWSTSEGDGMTTSSAPSHPAAN